MRSKKSSVVCITLAVILLFLGMCSQFKRADSVLASFQQMVIEAESALADGQQVSLEANFIDKAEIDSSYIGNGTSRLITGLRDTFQNFRKGQGRISLKTNVEFLCIEEILQMFLSFYIVFTAVYFRIRGSETIILNYIHNQDGEK